MRGVSVQQQKLGNRLSSNSGRAGCSRCSSNGAATAADAGWQQEQQQLVGCRAGSGRHLKSRCCNSLCCAKLLGIAANLQLR